MLTLFLAGLLAVVALVMYAWQRSAWRAHTKEKLVSDELAFYRRCKNRRSQISLLLGVVALGMGIGGVLRDPLLIGWLWLGIVVLLLGIILLALFDALASGAFFRRAQSRQLAEHASLQRELHEQLRLRSNSDPSP